MDLWSAPGKEWILLVHFGECIRGVHLVGTFNEYIQRVYSRRTFGAFNCINTISDQSCALTNRLGLSITVLSIAQSLPGSALAI